MAAIEGDEGLKILDEAFALEEYAICIAKGNDTLQDQIDQALEELRSEGIIDQIIENYIGDDTKGTCPYKRSCEVVSYLLIMVSSKQVKALDLIMEVQCSILYFRRQLRTGLRHLQMNLYPY